MDNDVTEFMNEEQEAALKEVMNYMWVNREWFREQYTANGQFEELAGFEEAIATMDASKMDE